MYGFILHAHTRPEQAEAFEQLFRAYVESSRAEPGCVEYHMLRDTEDPTLFIFYEVWASQQALALHASLPHMRAFHERRMDYLRCDFTIREIAMLSPASAAPGALSSASAESFKADDGEGVALA